MAKCNICGKPLTDEDSIRRGVGPVCASKIYKMIHNKRSNICEYTVNIDYDDKIIIINEIYDRQIPKMSLTNCIEYVVAEVCETFEICPNDWTFIEHSTGRDLLDTYNHYDLINTIDKTKSLWSYLWHSDFKEEKKPFSMEMIKRRLMAYKNGKQKVLNL